MPPTHPALHTDQHQSHCHVEYDVGVGYGEGIDSGNGCNVDEVLRAPAAEAHLAAAPESRERIRRRCWVQRPRQLNVLTFRDVALIWKGLPWEKSEQHRRTRGAEVESAVRGAGLPSLEQVRAGVRRQMAACT